jgi:mannose-6-phosphate isomerase-like protein (cupin superfamily)
MGCMATHPRRESESPPSWRLTDGLDAKLAELRDRGFEVAWIESSRADLTRLIVEGGEAAIRLDPDPAVDRAWYGDVEIRHNSAQDETWVFVRGEVAAGEISAHVVEPAGAAPAS